MCYFGRFWNIIFQVTTPKVSRVKDDPESPDMFGLDQVRKINWEHLWILYGPLVLVLTSVGVASFPSVVMLLFHLMDQYLLRPLIRMMRMTKLSKLRTELHIDWPSEVAFMWTCGCLASYFYLTIWWINFSNLVQDLHHDKMMGYGCRRVKIKY